MSKSTYQNSGDVRGRSIEEEAAAWFGRCELGLTPGQTREFMQWLEADTRHAEAMREMDETWDVLDGLKNVPGLAERAAQLAGGRKRPLRLVLPLIFAAAAALAVSAVVFWTPRPEILQAVAAATETVGMKKVELADGSVVHLNAKSEVKIHFTKLERQVQLSRGEAHFMVAKDAARPFTVTAGTVAVKAVGTAFNVRLQSAGVRVFVTEGTVRLDDSVRGQPLVAVAAAGTASPAFPVRSGADSAAAGPEPLSAPLLTAGQHAFIAHAGNSARQKAVVRSIEADEIRQALAWQAHQLDFDLTPLAEVVAQFNQHNTHRLVIDDSGLAQQPFGGTFRADKYEVFVQLLEKRFGVVAERLPDRTILRRAR